MTIHAQNPVVNSLSKLLEMKGCTDVVFSPGSRNAPLVIEFTQNIYFQCYTITDERSAAFFALGIAQKKQSPVALCCTSGSALLNYAPAIAEAYYQDVPLIVLSADRLPNYIGISDGQTIDQLGSLRNFVCFETQLTQYFDKESLLYNQRLINQSINSALMHQKPVHINIPFPDVGLYDFKAEQCAYVHHFRNTPVWTQLKKNAYKELINKWNKSSKKMILLGCLSPNEKTSKYLSLLDDPSVVVLAEQQSNILVDSAYKHIDRIFFVDDFSKIQELQPELLITLGKNIVSKKIKAFLRTYKPKEHWHVSPYDQAMDTFYAQTENIELRVEDFLETFCQLQPHINSNYRKIFKQLCNRVDSAHETFVKGLPFCDFWVWDKLTKALPDCSLLHLANSTPVRYVQLFSMKQKNISVWANRGTGGIDGSLSTALGASIYHEEISVVITGDLSFFYDSNALWNHYTHKKFRIILINNGGGDIFNFIPGPQQTPMLEEYFVTRQVNKAKHIASAFGLEYLYVEDKIGLDGVLDLFFASSDKAKIMEINTKNCENAFFLKNYFKYLHRS